MSGIRLARCVAAAARMLAVASVALLACRGDSRSATPPSAFLSDDFGDTLAPPPSPPQRIVSLNPATTAMLFAMGTGSRVVGRSRWDNYPPAVLAVPDLGNALRPNVEAVLAVHPDLVLLYANADDRDAARRLRSAGVATLSLRDDQVADFARVLRLIGRALHDSARAQGVVDSVEATLARVRVATAGVTPVSVVWVVDALPLRAIGGGSYLSELLADAGGRNVYAASSDPAPQVSLEDVLHRNPDVVLTSAMAAQILRHDPRWQRWLTAAHHRLLVPDSALVGTPSVRMGEAATELARMLHPQVPGVTE